MRTSLDGSACLLGAILLLTLPLPWILAAVLAAAFHEISHLLALRLTGTRIYRFRIGFLGAELETAPMDAKTELFCAAAGPVGSFSLLLLIHCCPRIAICGGVQGLFNLLPILPLDGGRILCSGMELLFPRSQLFPVAEKVQLILLLFSVLFLSVVFSLGLFPVLAAVALTGKAFLRKIPCKESKLAVQ